MSPIASPDVIAILTVSNHPSRVGKNDRLGMFAGTDSRANALIDPADLHANVCHLTGLDPERTVHNALNRPYPISTGRCSPPWWTDVSREGT